MDSLLFLLILILPAIAQMQISWNYAKYKQIENTKGLTGYEVARKILDANSLQDLYIVETKGYLSDHYDPTKKVVRLSSDIYHGKSIASLAVASHECGHALQDKEGYLYLKIRTQIIPVVNAATTVSYFIIGIGVLFQSLNLIWIGIACVATGLIFQLITLPVEINASKRAKKEIKALNLIEKEEITGVSNVLFAAASTYLAGVLTSALELLRLFLVFSRNEE